VASRGTCGVRRSAPWYGAGRWLFWLLIPSATLCGQTALVLSSGTASAGGTAALSLTLSAGTPVPIGLQWTFSYSAIAFASVNVTSGPALISAGKALTCVNASGSTKCLASGMNAGGIGNGVVATLTATLASGAGSTSVAVGNTLAVDLNGNSVAVGTMGGTITVQQLPVVSSVSVSSISVVGGSSISGAVTLSAPAPSGGAVVTLSASVPLFPATTVTIPAGSTSQPFVVTTNPVATRVALIITASYNGSTATSPAINVTPTSTSGTVTFVRADTTTAGKWKGVYGSEGYHVIGTTPNYPTSVTAFPAGNSTCVWANPTTDLRAPEKPGSTDGIAACWYAAGIQTVDLNFSDSATHQVALYMLDWDNYGGGRTQRVEILDASNNVVDTRTVSSFVSGQYLVWNISGHVVIRVTNTNPSSNAVVSGLLFDSGGGPTSLFVKADTTTSGRWKGVYGGDGAHVLGATANYPSYVTVTPSNNGYYLWADPTSDPRALQKPSSATENVAGCWYTYGTFTIDLNFTDTATHQVALYMVDFDIGRGRSQQVEIVDSTNRVIDSRTASNFIGGQYLVWNLSGRVVIRVTNINPSGNAVVSGIFFR
jgi:hypothetical protein